MSDMITVPGIEESTEHQDVQDLNYVRDLRKRIITEMVNEGLPSGKEDRAFLLAAMDGMDRATFSKLKLKADTAAQKSKEQTANRIAMILRETALKQQHYAAEAASRTLTLDMTLEDHVEGEVYQGIDKVDYENIMRPGADPESPEV